MKFFLSFFLFFLLLVVSVSAIGISPPDVKVDYKAGETYTFEVKVLNNGVSQGYVDLELSGELAEYVTLSQYHFQFKRGERYHPIKFTAKFPDYNDLVVFGKQRIYFYAQEGMPDASGLMGFRTSVKGIFIVDIPVPGKLGVINSFDVKNTQEGYKAPFTLSLRNRGLENLRDVSAKIIISDFNHVDMTSVIYDGINIDSDKEYLLNEVLDTTSFDSSKYFATVEFTYDPAKASLLKKDYFFVGSTDVELLSYTKNITVDKINKIDFQLQSLWGSPLKNIRGFIDINGVVQALPVLDFEPFENKHLSTFLDIPFTNESSVSAKLSFEIPVDAQNTAHKNFDLTFNVVKEELPSSEFPFSDSPILFVGIILVILLLLGVVLVVVLKRRK